MEFKNLPFLRHLTPRLAFCIFLMSISVFNFGLDNTAYSTIQAMDPFIKRFGTIEKHGKHVITPKHLSYLSAFPRITFAAGILIGGWTSERVGRRPVIIMMMVICLIGVIVSYTAKTYAAILIGRMIVHGYIGMEGCVVPMFQAEISPAAIRGIIVISYLFNHVFGSFIMSCITYKTAELNTDMSWKIPIAVMFVIPSLVLLLAWFLPESPRWLLRKGRDEEALKQLKYLYENDDQAKLEREIELLKKSLAANVQKGSWMDLLRGTNLRRTLIVISIQSFNQLTGQTFATSYGTVFIKTLGTINPYKFTLISNAIGCLGPFLTFFLVDRLGRRNMYLIFGTLCGSCLFVMGGLGLGTVTFQQKAGIVAMDILYPFFYCFSFGGMAPLTGAETPSPRLRDKSAIVGWSFQNLWAFVVTFVVPYLISDSYVGLHSKVGFIFGSICVVALVWAYFFFPELKGRSLEEVDEFFQARVSAKKSRYWKPESQSRGQKITAIEDDAPLADEIIYSYSTENVKDQGKSRVVQTQQSLV
ncbi:sugar transporter, putative [Talaromyces stipitatus ATCC 10500]|uniref:Sugar transporter, putative n=1 Tax=Talaromyces stipitatus (strain ATCC 10500 / CBS 375.48 / QM 6759 / NRRL 1006) TaxID=441959 RepID=B8MSL9_TALSN|nr:sugar transporter, putative [Talaromyces stipitatus ATCC 10500]EED12347.1 sugar transporter, putative [Talaromyces stipitatus ATCC 10500]